MPKLLAAIVALRAIELLAPIVIALGFLFVLGGAAHAADASTLVDYRPLLLDVLQLLAAAVLSGGLWALRLLMLKLKLDADSRFREYLETALRNGIGYAATRLQERIASLSPVDARNAIVADAATYAITKVPDALARFGIDSGHLADMITARLASVLGETQPHLVAPTAAPAKP